MSELTDTVAKAREAFLTVVDTLRPELHRYCARLTGSVIEGEDIVQEALARAFYAIAQTPELPALRPWLFRIAHNAALDYLKSHGKKNTELRADIVDVADLAASDDAPDPALVRAALAAFLVLPLGQRCAVILKDVLGHSLEESAETMGTSIMAVKASLVRGRAKLRELAVEEQPWDASVRASLDRYASLFNARDWEGVRALVSDECRLDLVSKAQRRGKQVRQYFDRYEREAVSLRVGRLDGELVLGAFVGTSDAPTYFILLAWEDEQVTAIRDFRYVTYIAREADFTE